MALRESNLPRSSKVSENKKSPERAVFKRPEFVGVFIRMAFISPGVYYRLRIAHKSRTALFTQTDRLPYARNPRRVLTTWARLRWQQRYRLDKISLVRIKILMCKLTLGREDCAIQVSSHCKEIRSTTGYHACGSFSRDATDLVFAD